MGDGNIIYITVKMEEICARRVVCRCESVSLVAVTFNAATRKQANTPKARIMQAVVTYIIFGVVVTCNQNEILKYDFKHADICMEMKLLHWNAVGCHDVGLERRKIIVDERKSNIKDGALL